MTVGIPGGGRHLIWQDVQADARAGNIRQALEAVLFDAGDAGTVESDKVLHRRRRPA